MDGNAADQLCPFCRTPAPKTDDEIIKQVKKRVEMGDVEAIYNLGPMYIDGRHGLPQDNTKALELFLRAGELGCAAAYNNIGRSYFNGIGVERNEKKAMDYYELGAMRGDVYSRHNLGVLEKRSGNIDRAMKHFMIAVEFGYGRSLVHIKGFFMDGHATKDEYEKALRSHQAYLDEIRSVQRDEAAAFNDRYKYY